MNHLISDTQTYELYMRTIVFLAPAFCSFVCALFVLFLIRNCKNRVERSFRILASVYFLMITVWWLSQLGYTGLKGSSLVVNIALGISYVFIPVLFYHILYYPTHIGGKRFPSLYYLLPIPVISVIMAVISLVIPAGSAVLGGGEVSAGLPGVERYALMFVSGPIKLLPALAFAFPTALTIWRHSRQLASVHGSSDCKRLGIRPLQWIVIFICLGVLLLAIGAVLLFSGESSLWYGIAAVVMSAQQILLTFHIIRRHYLSNTVIGNNRPKTEKEEQKERNGKAGKEKKEGNSVVKGWISSIVETPSGGGLSRMTLENYFHAQRPYINPDFKLVDLAEVMGVNRTEMSGFINRVYGMNFKRYVNRWRIEEYRRLMALPSNERKNPYKIVLLAGFSDSRHYQRALQSEKEQEEIEKNDTPDNSRKHPSKNEKTK